MITAAETTARILVVDDEQSITDLVAMALRYEHFAVQVAHSGREALDTVETFSPDLVVLDIMMPGIDGFEVARRLRNGGSSLPVLFLTARDATEDKVRGLTSGGDDYMTKPFGVEALGRTVVADLELDEDTHEVRRAGHDIELTATEFKLLRYLMLNARLVLSKDQILDHVWNYDFGGNANIVETYVSYLRRKIDSLGPPLIQTVRGVGYTIRTPRE